jgi:hypothetical protein
LPLVWGKTCRCLESPREMPLGQAAQRR